MLSIPKRITKEFLLKYNTQETYFEYYLGKVQAGLFRSPLRSDKHPTCSFYKNKKGSLIFKDFAGPSFDFIGCVMYIYKCSYYKALKIIANDFGYIKDEKVVKNECKVKSFSHVIIKQNTASIIDVVDKEFTKDELDFWYKFGVTVSTLKKYHVHSIKHVYINNHYCCSSAGKSYIFGYHEIDKWKIYMPKNRNMRFLTNWSSNFLQGGKQLKCLSDNLIITKSMKDVMVLHEFGIESVAPNSENIVITKAKFDRLNTKYKNIYILFDNDLAGVKGAHKYKKEFNIKCIFIRRKYSKDISDLHKNIAESSFWSAIEELNNIISGGNASKYFYLF